MDATAAQLAAKSSEAEDLARQLAEATQSRQTLETEAQRLAGGLGAAVASAEAAAVDAQRELASAQVRCHAWSHRSQVHASLPWCVKCATPMQRPQSPDCNLISVQMCG